MVVLQPRVLSGLVCVCWGGVSSEPLRLDHFSAFVSNSFRSLTSSCVLLFACLRATVVFLRRPQAPSRARSVHFTLDGAEDGATILTTARKQANKYVHRTYSASNSAGVL